MKKIIILMSLAISLMAMDLHWRSYQEIYNMHSDNLLEKPILVFMSAEGCKFCEKSLNAFNEDEAFKNFLNKHYERVYIDQTKDFVPVDLHSLQTPTFFVLSPKTLAPLTSEPAIGAIPIADLSNWLSEIVFKYREFLKNEK